MNANELRIGNWIYWNIPEKIGVPHKVLAVKSNIPNTCPISLGESYDDFLPIPLTPEILEKCGFEKKGKRYSKGWVYLWEQENNIVFALSEMYEFVGDYLPCKSLHQLQNLYYALTGEELTYTP